MKGKKEIISLTAAVLIMGLLAGLLFWQRGRDETPDTPGQEAVSSDQNGDTGEAAPTPIPNVTRLVDRTEAEIVRVVFQGPDGASVMLPFYDNEGLRQWMYEGVDYRLNNITTRNKVRAAFNIFSSQVVHEDINDVHDLNLDDFGFNLLIITAYYEDDTTLNLYLGGPTLDFTGHFFMVEGNPALYTISMPNVNRLLWGLEDMLDTVLPIWETETMRYLLIEARDRDPIELVFEPHPDMPQFDWLVMRQPFEGHEVYAMSFDVHVMNHFNTFVLGDLVSLHPSDFGPYGLDNPSLEFIYHDLEREAHLLFGDIFFREQNGSETAFIYVKFADRPHVFEALYEPLGAIFDINPLRFIARFIAILDILTVERIDVWTQGTEHVIYINPVEDDNHAIEPTVNGEPVNASDFRRVYRQLIGIGINNEIEPFTPRDDPVHTVLYTRVEGEDDVYLRFYVYDDHFLAVSVDGEPIWFVVTRRSFELFVTALESLI